MSDHLGGLSITDPGARKQNQQGICPLVDTGYGLHQVRVIPMSARVPTASMVVPECWEAHKLHGHKKRKEMK